MKVVILAAGKGTRMNELTEKTPKPLLAFQKENLLEHKFKNLPDSIDEIILVIGYLGDLIKKHFGNEWNGKKLVYVQQEELLGTAHSLWQTKDILDEKFIVLMGDDLYSKDDLEELARSKEWAILVWPESSRSGGKCVVNENAYLVNIIENDSDNSESIGLTYTGACLLTPEIFNYEMAHLKGKNEFGLPQTFIQTLPDRKIKALTATWWKRITSPEDLK